MVNPTPTDTSSVEALIQVLTYIIIILLVVLAILAVWRWLIGSDGPKEDMKKRRSPFIRPAGTPDKNRVDQVIMEPGTVTSVRPVNPHEKCGDSAKGEVTHYRKQSEAIMSRPTYDGGFTEMLDPATGENLGLYNPEFIGRGGGEER